MGVTGGVAQTNAIPEHTARPAPAAPLERLQRAATSAPPHPISRCHAGVASEEGITRITE